MSQTPPRRKADVSMTWAGKGPSPVVSGGMSQELRDRLARRSVALNGDESPKASSFAASAPLPPSLSPSKKPSFTEMFDRPSPAASPVPPPRVKVVSAPGSIGPARTLSRAGSSNFAGSNGSAAQSAVSSLQRSPTMHSSSPLSTFAAPMPLAGAEEDFSPAALERLMADAATLLDGAIMTSGLFERLREADRSEELLAVDDAEALQLSTSAMSRKVRSGRRVSIDGNDPTAPGGKPAKASSTPALDTIPAEGASPKKRIVSASRPTSTVRPKSAARLTTAFSIEDIENYMKQMAAKLSEIAKLCAIRTRDDILNMQTSLILFNFKEISSIVLVFLERLGAQVDTNELCSTSIQLTSMESTVSVGLAALNLRGDKPKYGEDLKRAIIDLLAATKAVAQAYIVAQSIQQNRLFVEAPGFVVEVGRLVAPAGNSAALQQLHRMSYSFSASASVVSNAAAQAQAASAASVDYANYRLEHIDEEATFYRKFFIGTDHRNYVGFDERGTPVCVSIKRESVAARDGAAEDEQVQYRAIFRTHEGDMRAVIPAESIATAKRIGKMSWKDIVRACSPSLKAGKLSNIEDGKIHDELLRLDEQRTIKAYKFGVLYCRGGQQTEEDMFGNENGSPAFDQFLNFLGKRVRLSEHTKFSGGLDTRGTNTTGTHSVYTEWRDFEVMFHVSTLLPFGATGEDRQQIQRKRHIGNDIVLIVFMDGKGQYDPRTIRSQFLHTFIVVQPIKPLTPGKPRYRVSVASNEDVPTFGPSLPKPAEFDQSEELRNFLYCKLINGENAAYMAPKFRDPQARARRSTIEFLVESFSNAALLQKAKTREKTLERREGKAAAKALAKENARAAAGANEGEPRKTSMGSVRSDKSLGDGASAAGIVPSDSAIDIDERVQVKNIFLSEQRKLLMMSIRKAGRAFMADNAGSAAN